VLIDASISHRKDRLVTRGKKLLDRDVTSRFTLRDRKGGIPLKRLYRTGQFAEKASVSLRTLRYYDQVGLLSPAEYTEAGYRLYTDEDLLRLQHILALKFLGFSLEEIQVCLRRGPKQLAEVLAQQRAMMEEKRTQLEGIIRALRETEALLDAGRCDWESVARVIEAIRMEPKNEWVKKYFTDEQLQTMQELGSEAYSEEALAKLQSRQGAWTEADQEKATADWTRVYSEARRLAAEGADPAGPEAQAIAKLKHELLSAFTQGDPEVSAGLNRFWEGFHALPQEKKPFDSSPFDAGEEGNALLEKACAIYAEGLKS
jgi:MerR family transcriptional regulator, thiopeptide resistance regulator